MKMSIVSDCCHARVSPAGLLGSCEVAPLGARLDIVRPYHDIAATVGGGLQVDPRQAEDDGHQYRARPGSNLPSMETSFSRKAPVKV